MYSKILNTIKNLDYKSNIVSGLVGLLSGILIVKLRKSNKKMGTNILKLIDTKNEGGLTTLLGSKDVYEEFYEELVKIKDEEPIDIIIKTSGGAFHWCLKICHFIKNRKGLVRVFVDDGAHSAGTVIALCADELYLTKNATLSAIDPQMSLLGILSTVAIKEIPSLLQNFNTHSQNQYNQVNDYFISQIQKFLHPKYETINIIDHFYKNVCSHSVIFFTDDLINLQIPFTEWDGDYSLSKLKLK